MTRTIKIPPIGWFVCSVVAFVVAIVVMINDAVSFSSTSRKSDMILIGCCAVGAICLLLFVFSIRRERLTRGTRTLSSKKIAK